MTFSKTVEHALQQLGINQVEACTQVQALWAGYGELLRLRVVHPEFDSVIIKSVDFSGMSSHPKGWSGEASHQRKLTSYQVEVTWYEKYVEAVRCITPMAKLLYQSHTQNGLCLVMEDLATRFSLTACHTPTLAQAKACLRWLARFHSVHLNQAPNQLWAKGSYWHLNTRQNELAAMPNGWLKSQANAISDLLDGCQFQTLIHGDAKLANFCLSDADEAAAVDFQYVGGGCGIKDVMLFISSIMHIESLGNAEPLLLTCYFETLSQTLKKYHPSVNSAKLCADWHQLYDVAWADFIRFLVGWSPQHAKINQFSLSKVENAKQYLQHQSR